MPTPLNAGGRIGPEHEALLAALLDASYGTAGGDREDFATTRGGNTNTIRHPGLRGRWPALTASDEDLRVLAEAGFIAVQAADAQRHRRFALREQAHRLWVDAQDPRVPRRPIGAETPG